MPRDEVAQTAQGLLDLEARRKRALQTADHARTDHLAADELTPSDRVETILKKMQVADP
jgi:hypothetical protein